MKHFSFLFLLLSISVLNLTAQIPVITSFTPTSGPVGTLITINGTGLESPTTFTISGVSAITVSNTGSTLVGMVMPEAETGPVSVSTAGGSATGDINFAVIPTPYPAVQQGAKLVGTGGMGAQVRLGQSVSVSADGNTAIVGGIRDNFWSGAAWVFIRADDAWEQQGPKLIGTGAIGNSLQGGSVSLSADGNTAIVGGRGDNNLNGAVWIYTRTDGVWMQQGDKLVGTGAVGNAGQGISVSLSADGNTAIVGGYSDNFFDGAIWVYSRTDGIWSQQGDKLVGTGALGSAQQGWPVSLSADGNTAIVGGRFDNNNEGSAWVFTRTDGEWSQQGNKFTGTGAVGEAHHGSSVALSADGNTAIVGGHLDENHLGAAWVYIRIDGVWVQQGIKLVGTGAEGDAHQGISVSLSADGNTAMVGGFFDDSSTGAAWVYTRSNDEWTQQGAKLVGSGAIGNCLQGRSVSLSADGNTAIVGGSSDNDWKGAVWVYVSEDVVNASEHDASTYVAYTIGRELIVVTSNKIEMSIEKLTITDMSGRTILSQIPSNAQGDTYRIRLPDLAFGIYIVTLHTANRSYSTKIVLE